MYGKLSNKKYLFILVLVLVLISMLVYIFFNNTSNNSPDTKNTLKDYEWDNIEIIGTWEANLSEQSTISWQFDIDNSFKYYVDGKIHQEGKFMYIPFSDSSSIDSDDNSLYVSTQNSPINEILLIYNNGGQRVINGVWSNNYVLRMNMGDNIIYFLNKEENLLDN